MSQHITFLDTYRLLGRSGLRASPLALGTMTFASNWGWGAESGFRTPKCNHSLNAKRNYENLSVG
jgi:aryl-alcohol dehydrogenase-like predicted oxidoreductase